MAREVPPKPANTQPAPAAHPPVDGAPANEPNLTVHRCSIFDESRVVHGITSRSADLPLTGNMSYMVGDDVDLVRQNRRTWAAAIGYDWSRLVLGRQVHETTVAVVDERHAGSGADSVETSLHRVDALLTQTHGLPIGIMAADCVPILIHDPTTNSIGAVHAGWRGTVDGITKAAIDAMKTNFGSRPEDLLVGLGPAICVFCYQVGDEVINRWRLSAYSDCDGAVREAGDGLYFDLRVANQIQLRVSGVQDANVETSAICTRCADGAMFSRRGLGPRTGLFASVIMLKGTTSQSTGLVA